MPFTKASKSDTSITNYAKMELNPVADVGCSVSERNCTAEAAVLMDVSNNANTEDMDRREEAAINWRTGDKSDSQNFSPNASDNGGTEHNDLDASEIMEELYEMLNGPNCSEYLICMNKNSNGKVSSEIDLNNQNGATLHTDGGIQGDGCVIVDDASNQVVEQEVNMIKVHDKNSPNNLRRVKTINMGEVPLRPVGLSLSGSGMELYVKVDSVLQKEKLAALKDQVIAQACATKKPTRRSKRKTQSASTDDSSALTTDGVESGIESVPPEPKDEFTTRLGLQNKLRDPIEPNLKRTRLFVEEKVDQEDNGTNNAAATMSRTDSAMGSLTTDSSNLQEDMPSDILLNQNRASHQPIWRIPKPKEDKRLSTLDTSSRRQLDNSHNNFSAFKRPIFTSSDLPLKRPSAIMSCSSGDILLHHERNNSSVFSPVPALRSHPNYALCFTNNARAFGSVDFSASKTKDYTTSPDTEAHGSGSSRYALESRQTDNLHPPTSTDTPYDPDVVPHASNKDGTNTLRRYEENMTPLSFADFDPAQVLASGSVDAETLAKFAQYTRSMRRDLKQNYKKLSTLMKRFNDDVTDRFNEQQAAAAASSTGSGSSGNGTSGVGEDVDDSKSDSSSRCSLM